MVQLNLALREINCKIVYFGPGLSGKTTNLEVVHERAPKESKGELTSIATESDRTLFFDFMPLNLGVVGGMKTKFQLYTVPGQVYYNSTRKLVLRGADGVVFVADSTPEKMEDNLQSLENLEECLRDQGRSLETVPHVIQFNKRDMPTALTVEELSAKLNRHGAPCVEAVAARGEGVVETFKALSGLVLAKVQAMSTDRPDKRRGPKPAAEKEPAPAEARPKSGSSAESRPKTGSSTEARPKTGSSTGSQPVRPTTGASPLSQPSRPATGGERPAVAVENHAPAVAVAAPPRPVATKRAPEASKPLRRTDLVSKRPNPGRATTGSHRLMVTSGRSASTNRSIFKRPVFWIAVVAAVVGGGVMALMQGIL